MRGMSIAAALISVALCSLSFAFAANDDPSAIHLSLRPDSPSEHILGSHDFRVLINGKPVPVLNAKTPRDGQMILLVLDLAGDVTDSQTAKDALAAEVQQLPGSSVIAVIRAQDGPTVLVDPTADRGPIADAIQNYPVSGKAGLLDVLPSVATLADNIAKAANVRIATLYVTDSSVRNYREDFANPVINSSDPHDLSRRFPEALIQEKIDKLAKSIASREAPIFIVHLHYQTTTLNAAYQGGLKRLAESTAGWSVFCASPAEIPQAIHEAFTNISSEYTLTVGLPPRAPSTLQIHIEPGSPTGYSGDVVYRARLLLKKR
jgi:hypothetical protein